MQRGDNRQVDQLREIEFNTGFQSHPAGSVLVKCGGTRVICSVSVQDKVPGWMKVQGVPGGWVTSEYSMLPSATHDRVQREAARGKQSGRTMEIQRLIGRSLRAIVDLGKLGERTLYVDCDVIDADGGTRCASITGASVALQIAVKKLMAEGLLSENPIKEHVAAISIGVKGDNVLLDLCYEEDSSADVDMNVVMTEDGKFVEIQGTAEEEPFSYEQMQQMVQVAQKGLNEIFELQRQAVADA